MSMSLVRQDGNFLAWHQTKVKGDRQVLTVGVGGRLAQCKPPCASRAAWADLDPSDAQWGRRTSWADCHSKYYESLSKNIVCLQVSTDSADLMGEHAPKGWLKCVICLLRAAKINIRSMREQTLANKSVNKLCLWGKAHNLEGTLSCKGTLSINKDKVYLKQA